VRCNGAFISSVVKKFYFFAAKSNSHHITKLTININMPINPNTNKTPTMTKGTKDGCSKSLL
jgi:hypothetical protein